MCNSSAAVWSWLFIDMLFWMGLDLAFVTYWRSIHVDQLGNQVISCSEALHSSVRLFILAESFSEKHISCSRRGHCMQVQLAFSAVYEAFPKGTFDIGGKQATFKPTSAAAFNGNADWQRSSAAEYDIAIAPLQGLIDLEENWIIADGDAYVSLGETLLAGRRQCPAHKYITEPSKLKLSWEKQTTKACQLMASN